MPVLNIAAYRFVSIDDGPALAMTLRERCLSWNLKGTVLIAPEGINLFLAGRDQAIESFLEFLKADPRFAAMPVKRQFSDHPPFAKLKVKLKREIVPLGEGQVSPANHPAPRIDAATLKRWLDEGRDLILLDTRNRFEFDHGAFETAIDLGIRTFRSFPEAIEAKRDDWQDRPIVCYCTGGIRCEKAAPVMIQQGFQNVYQLDGGILKYFEQFGTAHFRGDCFVFDERIGVDGSLRPRTSASDCNDDANRVTGDASAAD
jgi:UPF0176 protein